MQHTSNPKVQAKHLQRLLTDAGTPTTHTQAQQLVARSLGFASWQALKAAVPDAPRPALAYALDVVMDYHDGHLFEELLLLPSADARREMRAYLSGLIGLFGLRRSYRLIDRPARVALDAGLTLTTPEQALGVFLESSEYHRMTDPHELPDVDLAVQVGAEPPDVWEVSGELARLTPDAVRDLILTGGRVEDAAVRALLEEDAPQEALTGTVMPRALARWLTVKAAADPAWMPAHRAVMAALSP